MLKRQDETVTVTLIPRRPEEIPEGQGAAGVQIGPVIPPEAIQTVRANPRATVGIAAGVLLAFDWLATVFNYGIAALLGGVVILLAGAAAAGSAVVAKWLLVGRIRPGEHPLWSSFIWRNEVVDTFIEMVSAPWFARSAAGTPALVWWLRALGARIGAGTWCEDVSVVVTA